jgi:hypothetical protein
MSLYIANEKVSEISGPITFAILMPTAKLQEETWIESPILMLLGDHHDGIDKRCDESPPRMIDLYNNKGGLVLRTMDKSFYKALDSIALPGRPIDYHVESFFPFKFLQKDNYLVLDRKNLVGVQDTTMNQLPNKYLACFSKNKERKKEVCFTENIRYHLVDLRFNHLNFALEDDDKMHTSDLCFEAELNDTLHCCAMMQKDLIPLHKSSHVSAISILEKACNNPMDFARELFNMSNPYFLKKSLIFKQVLKMKKSIHYGIWLDKEKTQLNLSNPAFLEMRDLFLDYCKVYYEKKCYGDSVFTFLTNATKECISIFKTRNPQTSEASLADLCGVVNSPLIGNFNELVRLFLFKIFFPIVDIYYLFRTWKVNTNKEWLSIFHAGDDHIQNIIHYSKIKGWFTEEAYVHNSNFESPAFRCLQLDGKLPKDIHLDRLYIPTLPYLSNVMNKPTVMSHQQVKEILEGMNFRF